ncbi:MAG: aconitase X [Candidatus Nezhaarchaeales archaeon]
MKLSRTEKLMLRGYYGDACRKALELILAIADSYGYGELVKIRSAHVSGVSYKNIGDSGIDFLNDLVKSGGHVRVKTTMNPCGFDLDKPWLFNVDDHFFKRQMEIIKLLELMGVEPTLTCTPYYVDNKPKKGDHLAWAESSAVVYVNSVIGAYTNRESGPSALAAAITGRTALTRDHTNDRKPEVVVRASLKVFDYLDWSVLGYAIGLMVPSQIPLVKVKRATYNKDKLKCFSAGLGTSSSTSMFWLSGDDKDLEKIDVTAMEIREIKDKWALTRKPTLIFIGCPHCSLQEIKSIARELQGKRVRKDVKLLISTSRGVYAKASQMGLSSIIRKAGAYLIKDTCLVVSPIKLSKSDVLLTDSAKTAHYAETMTNAMIAIGGRKQCLKEALEP